jgi:hypothetical protein
MNGVTQHGAAGNSLLWVVEAKATSPLVSADSGWQLAAVAEICDNHFEIAG